MANWDEYSSSDKLAFALFCVAGIMAIILFFADFNPLTIVTLLIAMLALSIFPIVHFMKTGILRVAAFVVVLLVASLLGWHRWPKGIPADSVLAQAAPQGQSAGTSGNGSNNTAANVNQSGNGTNNAAVGNNNKVGNTYNNINVGPKLTGSLIAGHDPTPTQKCPHYDPFHNTSTMDQKDEIPDDHIALFIGSSVFMEYQDSAFPRTVIRAAGKPNFILERDKDGKLYVSIDIFDSDYPNPKIIAVIKRNEFKINNLNYFDMNLSPDKSRLKVVDQHNVTVLNIHYINKHAISIEGVLHFPGVEQPLIIEETKMLWRGQQNSRNCIAYVSKGLPLIDVAPQTKPYNAAVILP